MTWSTACLIVWRVLAEVFGIVVILVTIALGDPPPGPFT